MLYWFAIYVRLLILCNFFDTEIKSEPNDSVIDDKDIKVELESGSEDVDDDYQSYHTANNTSNESSATSTSGLASATSSTLATSSGLETVQKILVSREVNDAIFKPGTFFFYFFMCLFWGSIDF